MNKAITTAIRQVLSPLESKKRTVSFARRGAFSKQPFTSNKPGREPARRDIRDSNHSSVSFRNHVSKMSTLERRDSPHPKETSTPKNKPTFSQESMCNDIRTTSRIIVLTRQLSKFHSSIPAIPAIPSISDSFLSTCPKSYTFEILGCLQAVTPLLKFMPQFHSVTPLICSGSQETGQAGASGESQPWVPKGQGETQAARPNRKQLRQAAVANRFAETLRQKDREKSVTCRKRERNSNSAFTETFPFPFNFIFQNRPKAFAELSFHASSGSRRGCIGSEF